MDSLNHLNLLLTEQAEINKSAADCSVKIALVDHAEGLGVKMLLTSFEKASFLELLQAEILWSNSHQRNTFSCQVRLQFADLWCNPSAHLTAEPTQEEQDHRLIPPQRLELHTLKHADREAL